MRALGTAFQRSLSHLWAWGKVDLAPPLCIFQSLACSRKGCALVVPRYPKTIENKRRKSEQRLPKTALITVIIAERR